ncbi:GNAT family N-acetyltransferase [Sphingomonas quercus]|uniref:GNAT family N-acetyltransferase n=1 Tax=Sphingomonas quercus TaxID=2842451 RepID=A0ABS6BHS4_9SPHN|nr:GNAT family N-acetyltransferase [Sphingomonas quercus]MBU3077851.1 GNAT family N-acetyltransferase [Sphingomonas quercus]
MVIAYRDAVEADLPAIVALLADDELGAEREDVAAPLVASYVDAFHAIAATHHLRLIVAVDGERIVGTMQFLLIPGLSSRGSWHGQIEAVRIAADLRGQGQGEAFVRWAIEQCRLAGCASVQLVSHESRRAAHRFWRKLGFVPSHVGFKLHL